MRVLGCPHYDGMQAHPFARGSRVAVLAAVLFGVTAPLVRYFGAGVGGFATATLLYAGAALGCGIPRPAANEPNLGRSQLPRVVLIALLGAALAPASLAWGLQRIGALSGSLLLNLEGAFTVLLARVFYKEPLGRRFLLAVSLMIAGGAVLALRIATTGETSWLGLGALVVATLGWALDNTLARPLADFDARAVVFWKAVAGATLATLIALVLGERWARSTALFGLLACGAIGYGLSLRLYLQAQRSIGAARVGSLFAFGPFVGAAVAFGLGDRSGAYLILPSAALFGLAIYLHLTETHQHRHVHDPIEHDHAHHHDDGHHFHVHYPPVIGVHSHPHHHERLAHDHPHGTDLHHRHEH